MTLRMALPLLIVGLVIGICWLLWPRAEQLSPFDRQRGIGKIRLTQKYYFNIQGMSTGELAFNAVLHAFAKKRPDVEILPSTMFRMPGNSWNGSDMLTFAGKSAADIQGIVFHQLPYFREQGMLLRLNKWIGEDTNGDGVLSDDEVKWKPFLSFPPAMRRMAMDGPNIYAIPTTTIYANGLIYRKDLMREAGLDPRHGPRTWDELWTMGQKLTFPEKTVPGSKEKGQYALPSTNSFGGGDFYPFLYSCGGDLARGEARLPGHPLTEPPLYSFSFDDDPYRDPRTGHQYKPGEVQFTNKAAFNSEKGKKALRFLRKLRFAPWTRCPQCAAEGRNAPLDLTTEQVAGNYGVCPRHGKFALADAGPNQVIKGIMLPTGSADASVNQFILLAHGKFAMISAYITEQISVLSPKVIGFCMLPPPDAHTVSYAAGIPMFFGICSDVTDPQKQQAAWDYLQYKMGPEANKIEAKVWAESGMAPFVQPDKLKQAGLDEYLREVPPDWIATYNEFKTRTRVIPFCKGWLPLEQELQSCITLAMTNEHVDWETKLDQVAAVGNAKYFQGLTAPQKRHYRGIVILVCLFVLVMVVGGATFILRERVKEARESARQSLAKIRQTRIRTLSAWLLLLPALLSLLVWAYYPLIRGSLLAFQDYRLRGHTTWTGFDNFIEGLITGHFLHALVVTVSFVALSMTVGFLAPILIAVLLAEVPRWKYFFRMIFYLPAVMAGLVVTLMWMQFYLPSDQGFLNALLKQPILWLNHAWQVLRHNPQAVLINYPVQWLANVKTAMMAVIVPSIWAGAGPGSILYLAALKTIPEEIYEAADLDGAGAWAKFRYITLPYLTPLILINFIGAFIGSFQNMGNILVMTGGGPDYATHVVSLEIWLNAYANLRYGVATAQAWMLGSILIGFAVLQMRLLQRLNWRRADA